MVGSSAHPHAGYCESQLCSAALKRVSSLELMPVTMMVPQQLTWCATALH
jgi:hypothetical protein